MKIVHICLIDDYSEGWSYHRNILSEQNIRDGWETVIITSNYYMDINGDGVLTDPGVFYTKSGIKIIRLEADTDGKYENLNGQARWRLPFKGLYHSLCTEMPDLIFCHNVYFRNLPEVAKYKSSFPHVKIVGDNHADVFNSLRKGKKWKDILTYKLLIQPRIRKYVEIFDEFFYQSDETKDFFEKYIGKNIPTAKFMPLPAPIVNEPEKQKIKQIIRKEHSVRPDEFLFVHSGKLVKEKKTSDIFEALKKSDIKCKLIIIGSIPESNRPELEKLIEDEKRCIYLGWKNSEELRDYLAAADLYLQPGTQSVTMLNALSAGTPVLIYPHISYEFLCNGCEFQVRNSKDIMNVFEMIRENPNVLLTKSESAYLIAREYFDVRRQTKVIYGMVH